MQFKGEVHTCHVLDITKAQGLNPHGFCFRSALMSENRDFDDSHEVSRQWEGCGWMWECRVVISSGMWG